MYEQAQINIAFDKAVKLLRDLADIQNGPPLFRDTQQWNKIMREVYDFLEEWEEEEE